MCSCKPQSDDITRVLHGTHLPRALPASYPHTCRESRCPPYMYPLLLLQPTHPTWGMYRNDTTLHITHLHKPNLEPDPKLSCNHEEVHFCTHRAPIAWSKKISLFIWIIEQYKKTNRLMMDLSVLLPRRQQRCYDFRLSVHQFGHTVLVNTIAKELGPQEEIWNLNSPTGVSDELISFWWPKVKVTVTSWSSISCCECDV